MSDYPANYIVRFPALAQNCLRSLVGDSSNRLAATEDFVLTGADTTTQLLLPGFFIPYPELKGYGYIHYRMYGKIARTAGVNTILIEPVVDGVATGAIINSGAIATRTGTGWIQIDIQVGVVQHEDKTPFQAVRVDIISADSTGAKVDDIRLTGKYAISPFLDHVIYFRLKNGTADATNLLDLRSFMAGHYYARSL